MIASRNKDADYLASLRARGYDPDRIVRNLDWNMLNQVCVHGYFHADLHPANLFVLPGNAIGYVDYGIVGSLPDETRNSLTHYSWLLFHGDVDAAVTELMRWLAPTTTTDPEPRARTSSACIVRSSTRWARSTSRLATSLPPSRRTARSPAAAEPVLAPRDGHHARDPRPPAHVFAGHRRLPEDARDARNDPPRARHQLRPACQRAALLHALHAPASAFAHRSPSGHGAVLRGVRPDSPGGQVLEFVESQESFIVEAKSTLLGFRRRMQAVRRGWCSSASPCWSSARCCISCFASRTKRGACCREAWTMPGPIRPACHPAAPDRPDRAPHARAERRRLTR